MADPMRPCATSSASGREDGLSCAEKDQTAKVASPVCWEIPVGLAADRLATGRRLCICTKRASGRAVSKKKEHSLIRACFEPQATRFSGSSPLPNNAG